jgi:hypothetical protein
MIKIEIYTNDIVKNQGQHFRFKTVSEMGWYDGIMIFLYAVNLGIIFQTP